MTDEITGSNPYAAPESVSSTDGSEYVERVSDSIYTGWIVVVLLNIPLPIFFGFMVSSGFSRAGMLVGIAIVGLSGYWLCGKVPVVMSRLCVGAVITAMLQLFPILHIYIGSAAIALTSAIFSNFGGGPQDTMDGILEVTTATLLTGSGIIILALVIGGIIGLFYRPFSSRRYYLR